MLLQDRGQMTAGELGRQLEVSPRTILRDIEALSGAGVPVFATRGAHGGFRLLGPYERSLPMPAAASSRHVGGRARARLSLRGRRLVALTGRPAGVVVRSRTVAAGGADGGEAWFDATWPIDTLEAAVLDVLGLGAEVEVVAPAELRAAVADVADRVAARHASPSASGRRRQRRWPSPGRPAGFERTVGSPASG
jgi:predicted DNA-binding transcriptional regulator YafY